MVINENLINFKPFSLEPRILNLKLTPMKKAVCVGINNYPGTANDLQGCINDANDWSSLLESFGFQTSKILDEQATKVNIKNAFQNLITEASAGDVVVFTYSGHGTQVLDTNGDEHDSYDEALYVFDGPIVDDELRAILNNANDDAQIIIITDSCFSGTVTRALVHESIKTRFIKTDSIPSGAQRKKPFLSKTSDNEMIEILLTGCSDKEYSYDADINGKWNGAMTANIIPLIDKELTYNELYTRLRTRLPSAEYPQTPQLEGSVVNKTNKVFAPKYDTGSGSNSSSSGSSGCFSILIPLIAIAAGMILLLSGI